MLNPRYDKATLAFGGQAANSQVIRFGSPAGENSAVAMHSASPSFDQSQKAFSCILDDTPSGSARCMLAGRVDVSFG